MTVKILKSQISSLPDFEVRVAAHALEMKNWRAHMARVRQDDGKPDLPPIERHMACPRPGAHPLVESAVNESDVADYQIVDDGPTPARILTAKKIALFSAVSHAEQTAIEIVAPMGKRRLQNIRENDIRAADDAKAEELKSKKVGLLAPIGLGREPSTEEVVAGIEASRAPSDTAHLADQTERRRKIEIIQRAAAQAHSDIEDLTADTIGAWEVPDFAQ